jgi:hypothetical protein
VRSFRINEIFFRKCWDWRRAEAPVELRLDASPLEGGLEMITGFAYRP